MSEDWNFDSYKNAPPEQRLAVIGAEIISPVEKIRGFAVAIRSQVSSECPDTVIENVNICVDYILEASDFINILIKELVVTKKLE